MTQPTPTQGVVTVEKAWAALMGSISSGWLYKYDKARTANLLLDRLMAGK